MRYRPFGKTGLFVSELCLGTMTFGGKGFWTAIGKLSAAEAEAMIGAALDAGVNFIDTADGYSEGESEKLVGAALASLARPRDQVVVATKVHLRMGPGAESGRPVARAHLRRRRRQPPPPETRPHRPLSDPRLRSRHPDRRDGSRAGRRGA